MRISDWSSDVCSSDLATTWGIIENVLNVEESTVEFFLNVLDEVIDLFPSAYTGVGGDECPKKQWNESRRVQDRMRERSEARSVGKEGVSTGRSRGWPYN